MCSPVRAHALLSSVCRMPLNELQKRTLLVLIKASIDDLLGTSRRPAPIACCASSSYISCGGTEPNAIPSADLLLRCIAPLQIASGQTWKVLSAQPRLFGWIAEKNHPMNFTVCFAQRIRPRTSRLPYSPASALAPDRCVVAGQVPPVVQKDWATVAEHLKDKVWCFVVRFVVAPCCFGIQALASPAFWRRKP